MKNALGTRIVLALLLVTLAYPTIFASSHREAPLIVADPLADNTDTYAFRSTEPGRSGFVTIIANWIPFQEPSGGPHFYKFDDTVLYEIYIDNTGDGVEDITYQFRFKTTFKNPNSILGMAAPNQALKGAGGIEPLITSLNDPDYNEPQTYSVTRIDRRTGKSGVVLAKGLITPPNNIGERTTPNYETALGQPAVYPLPNGGKVFAGQRDEGFYIDVGGVFDTLKLKSIGASDGVDSTAGFNVNTIAIEVPIQELTRSGAIPSGPTASDAVVGVWAVSSRPKISVLRSSIFEDPLTVGPAQQVSRLGSPLVNELVIPLKLKDAFNRSTPAGDSQFAQFVTNPQLALLLSAAFGINVPPAPRNDLVAIFATGIPVNSITGPNFTTFLSDGKPHEMLRLNVAIPPSASPSNLGLLGGDVAGFPNGRRVFDDVVDISLRAVAGGTPFTPAFNISPNNAIGDGVSNNDIPFLTRFPYLGTPQSGNSTLGAPHQHHTISFALEKDHYNALRLRANKQLTQHRFAEALETAREALKIRSDDYVVWGQITDALVELRDYPGAIKAAQTMVDLRPASPSYARISYLRSLHGDTRGAIQAMALAVQASNPTDVAWYRKHLGIEVAKCKKDRRCRNEMNL